jgi:hypothetical protein
MPEQVAQAATEQEAAPERKEVGVHLPGEGRGRSSDLDEDDHQPAGRLQDASRPIVRRIAARGAKRPITVRNA